jgi:large subunit ribosomal protein L30
MEKEKKTQSESKPLLAVVRVRGMVNLRTEIMETFKHINLYNKNWCVLLENTPQNLGSIIKVKDFATWGEISDEVKEELIKKRGELLKERTTDSKKIIEYNNYTVYDGKKYKKYFRLAPPKKGYGSRGVKFSFTERGALGYRADKINDLLKRMI